MRQLFVCHTQYNLILAAGLSIIEDDLILFKDFNLTDELKERLEGHFHRCMFLAGNYPKKEMTAREKLERISGDNRKLKSFIRRYDRILIVDDMCIQEMAALKYAHQKNPSVEMAWLEDGATAYYRNGVVSTGMGSTPIKRLIRKSYFCIRYKLGSFYDFNRDMGMHRKLTSIYTCYPDYVLDVYRGKKLIEISDEQFSEGMEFMFEGERVAFEPGAKIIALDKIDNYGNKRQLIETELGKLINKDKQNGKQVYYKCHPRETCSLDFFSNAVPLEKTIALEAFLTNSLERDLTVVGIMSTALMTAKKMGYNVISLAKATGFDTPQITEFYNKIGIECK